MDRDKLSKSELNSLWEIIAPLTDNLQKLITYRQWHLNVVTRQAAQMTEFQKTIYDSVWRDHPNAPLVIEQGRELWETTRELGECLEAMGDAEKDEAELMTKLLDSLISLEGADA